MVLKLGILQYRRKISPVVHPGTPNGGQNYRELLTIKLRQRSIGISGLLAFQYSEWKSIWEMVAFGGCQGPMTFLNISIFVNVFNTLLHLLAFMLGESGGRAAEPVASSLLTVIMGERDGARPPL